MASNNRFIKDPSAVLDYQWDWSQWLAVGETISAVTLTYTGGITENSHSNTNTTVTAWISGGLANSPDCTAACRIVTNQGRTDERTITIQIRDL